MGVPIDPHGYPEYYQDGAGLALELCLPPPAGYAAVRPDLCIFGAPESASLQVGPESFWWMADAEIAPLVPGGKALLVMALEAAFTAEVPVDGQQMSFVRLRIRVDVPTDGDYTITHPFGVRTFTGVTAAEGINMTEDIGSINVLDPAAAFTGALTGVVGPFLAWPDYQNDPGLKGFAADGTTVLEQYIGNPGVPHVVTGGTNGNLFRIQGPGVDVQTDLFSVMGKVYDPNATRTAHVFPPAPQPKLFAVGPVNRVGAVGVPTVLQPEGIRTGADNPNLPVGFPLWYQDHAETSTPAAPVGGVKLGFCPAEDPMCITAPPDPAGAEYHPDMNTLRMGAEGFWWSAEAQVNSAQLTGGDARGDALLVLALEATWAAFPPASVPLDGQQIGFARLRIRVDTPVAGTYTITHPYGTEVFENVPAGRRGLNATRDIMIIDAADPDNAFTGALFGDIGPQFLKWTTFNADPGLTDLALKRPVNPADPLAGEILYVGNPVTPHAVTGGTNGNVFRIQGPNGINVVQNLFTVSGRLFNPVFQTVTGAPVANPDTATLNPAIAPSVTIDVRTNDTATNPPLGAVTVLPAGATSGPNGGTAVVDGANSVVYTPNPGFSGTDTFTYNVVDALGLTSNNAIVTVTVTPVDTITLRRAIRLNLRRLQLQMEGTGNAPGSILTIHAGPTAGGAVIGQARVGIDGRWFFRGTARTNLTSISIVSSSGGTLLNQPVQAR